MKKTLAFCVTSLALSGCVTTFANLGMVSSESQFRDGAKYKKIGKCKFLDKRFFFFVYWDGIPSIERAVQGCMEQHKNAAYISSASFGLYQNWWVLFMWTGYQVEGNVYGLVNNQPAKPSQEESFRLVPTSNGLTMTSESTSEEVVAVPHLQ